MEATTPVLANGSLTPATAEASAVNGAVRSNTSASSSIAGAAQGAQCLAEMNSSFAKCLSLVCPPIQYPPHCRFNPVQQDAADMSEIEARLEEFFLHAKQIELLFLRDANASATPSSICPTEQRAELEMEIVHLENELNEKNDLIEKYADVIRGWEGKFKRLDNRMTAERE